MPKIIIKNHMVMAFTFVAATKLTTAANAIVLQFTEPIFVILLMWIIYKKRPRKEAVATCVLVFGGILCFFFESLHVGGMTGNVLAIVSGFFYALVFMMKRFPGADFESSILLSNAMSMVFAIPAYMNETTSTPVIWSCIVLLGAVQCGLSYVLLSISGIAILQNFLVFAFLKRFICALVIFKKYHLNSIIHINHSIVN